MSATRSSAVLARTATLAVALTLTATACGGSDEGGSTTSAATTDTMVDDTASTEAPADDTGTTEAPADDTGTTAPADDMAEDTATTAAPAADGSTSIEGAVLWTSTDGKASMEISPDWTEMAVAGTAITWSINDPAVPEANLNILTSPVGEASAQDFIDASQEQIATLGDIKVLDSGITNAADGTEIGYIETQGEVSTAPGMDLHFYMTFNIANGQVAQATFTASEENWAKVIDGVRPYMETIKSL